MTGLNHRESGVVGAALTEDVVCELIADCFHIHRGLFLVYKAKRISLYLLQTALEQAVLKMANTR